MGLSWRMDAEVAGITALVAGDAAAFLSGTCPSMFTIRTFRSTKNVADQENTALDLHIGMTVGSAMALIVAAGGSLVTGSWWPFVGGLLALLALNGAYEWAIRNPHDRRPNIAAQ